MDYIKAEIEERLSDKRKTHTYGVMDTAEKLAVRYGADVEKTRLAALCHDLYRSTPQKELNELVKAKGLSKKYIDNKDLSHGRLAACTMEDKFGISDEEVLNAVRYHTTGRAGMCLLEKIIYLADAIEPGRNYPGIEEQRALAFEDLDKALHPLKTSVQTLQNENNKLKTEVGNLKNQLSNTNKSIDSLQMQTQANSNAIAQTANELGVKITATETNANQKISEVDKSLSKNSLYGIIAVLSAILLSGLLYWLLSKRQKTDKTEVVNQLQQTKTSIEESLVKEFGKQTDLIESQLELLAQQKTESTINANAEPDHSLALKVASEINLIERNINLMDKGTKGLKQLERSVGKLKDNLSANGYEMPELLGKQYHQGMKVIVTSSIPDEELEKGSEIITKVLIPQVNYNEKMIQTAQIEVAVGM